MGKDSQNSLVGDGVPVGLDQRLVDVQSTGLSGPGSDRGLLFSAVTRKTMWELVLVGGRIKLGRVRGVCGSKVKVESEEVELVG